MSSSPPTTKIPNFIGLGAQKAGTSWIHACLYEHPQTFMPVEKELHFFSRYYCNGTEWYESLFTRYPPDKISGEFSPTYLYDEQTPKRIHKHHPDIKLLVCLREPVSRTVSAYRYAIQTGMIPHDMSFDDVIERYPAYREHSCYYTQIELYLQFFDKEQLLITLYEDIFQDPYDFIQHIYEFLSVDSNFRPTMAEQKVNASRSAPRFYFLDRLMNGLAIRLRQMGLGHFVWIVGRSSSMERVRQLNTRSSAQPTVSATRKLALQRFFAPDVRSLEKLLRRDLCNLWFDYGRAMAD